MKLDVNKYLAANNNDEDMAERAYVATVLWINDNYEHFTSSKGEHGEAWGKIEGEITVAGRDGANAKTAFVNREVLASFIDSRGFDHMAVLNIWARKKWIVLNPKGGFFHNTYLRNIETYCIVLRILPDAIRAIKADQQAADTLNVDASDISACFDPKDPKTDQCVNNLLSALKISEEADRARDFDFAILKYLAVQAERAAQRVYTDDDITDPGEARRQVRECMSLIKDVVCEIERRFEE